MTARWLWLPFAMLCGLALPGWGAESDALQVTDIRPSGEVKVSWRGQASVLKKGQAAGPWTLMAVTGTTQRRSAVFEDFTQKTGHILMVQPGAARVDLPKSLESAFAGPSTLYHGHTLNEVVNSETDLLGGEVLSRPGDPGYDDIARAIPPISKMRTHSFVGTHENMDKVGFTYGGATSHFDPVVYVPAIEKIRTEGKVWNGLVGDWLPALRYVYPEDSGAWTELVAYAPFRVENGNKWIQQVWYRVARIENDRLAWVRYFDSYHPFPPRLEYPPEPFYTELLQMREGWDKYLAPGMRIQIPDKRVENMARHSLVRDLITRIGVQPKYGVFDKNYGGSEHDGFPDTFNVDTAAMLEWGLLDLAGGYIDNYFGKFVRDDGSILYRGPETGQYGRMLTVVAQYVNYGGDPKLVLKNRSRIDGVTRLLLAMREKALKLAPGDPAYGMISGWSEADACLDPEPERYSQPYFSNSTEAIRGFRDIGAVWERLGRESGSVELSAWGKKLSSEAARFEKDLQTSISRSILKDASPVCLPAIAGVKEPFDVASKRDRLDPQYRSYRPYMEMLFSGNLTREQVEMVVKYRAAHRDTILGIPTAYGYDTHEIAGFLTYGHGYGLLQHDMIREFLMTLYSTMAHQYTRGVWTAPETRNLDSPRGEAPYCTPAQLVVPLFARWMLVFEDPQAPVVWLAKGAPREWMDDGQRMNVDGAPTRWGRIGFTITSHMVNGEVRADVRLPVTPFAASVKLRLRAPEGKRLQAVAVNGKEWTAFDATEESVTLPVKMAGKVSIVASYR